MSDTTKRKRKRPPEPEIYNPSPDEIRRACERIRATWSEAKHQDRGWKKTVPFNWPMVSDQELIETIEEEERDERGDR